ncbi:hypothetical protein D9M71_629430 [compost metagenome]
MNLKKQKILSFPVQNVQLCKRKLKRHYRKAITVKVSALQVIALQRKKNKIIGHSNGGIKKKISYNKPNLKIIKMLSDF